MTIDEITRYVCPLRCKQDIEKFTMNTFDFSDYRIRAGEFRSDNAALEEKIKFRIKD
jgi:hypothetical protein